MKRKIFAAISVTLFLVATLFIVFPAKSQFAGTIKIGAVGPQPWIQGKGITEGCKLAAKEINTGGGIEVGGSSYEVVVVSADTLRGQPDPTTATGTAAGMELVAAGVDYIIGGFRTEATYGVREVAMDSALASDKPIYIIAGAATNELIDCAGAGGGCGACVRCDYNRYRFLFRATPMNSTMLFNGIAGYLKYVMAAKLCPIITGYASPLPIAVISEDLTWTQVMHTYLTMEYFWNIILGMNAYGNVSVVNAGLVGPTATDVSSELLAAEAAGARLIIHVLSGPVGRTMAIQYADLGIPAILSGIDVPGQEIPVHWEATGGKCEYESFLATAGTRTPVTPISTAFWDNYNAEYGHAPIYTSYGAYDGVRAIREMIEAVGIWPMGAEERVPWTEMTHRLRGDLPGGTSMTATFRYTGPHPMSDATYDTYDANATHTYLDLNPIKKGTLHELYHTPAELGPVWYPPYYGRSLVSQWQKDPISGEGRLEVFYPMSEAWSKSFKIPPALYSHADSDMFGALGFPDGYVNSYDMGLAAYCWLSSPGDAAWINYAGFAYPGLVADQDGNALINIADVSVVGKAFGYDWSSEYLQWPLG